MEPYRQADTNRMIASVSLDSVMVSMWALEWQEVRVQILVKAQYHPTDTYWMLCVSCSWFTSCLEDKPPALFGICSFLYLLECRLSLLSLYTGRGGCIGRVHASRSKDWYLSLPSLALSIIKIVQILVSSYQDNVTGWDIRPWCRWYNFPMGQHYKVKI